MTEELKQNKEINRLRQEIRKKIADGDADALYLDMVNNILEHLKLKEENESLRRYIEDIDKDIEELQKEMDKIKNRPPVDTSYTVGRVIE